MCICWRIMNEDQRAVRAPSGLKLPFGWDPRSRTCMRSSGASNGQTKNAGTYFLPTLEQPTATLNPTMDAILWVISRCYSPIRRPQLKGHYRI